ncbi:MAG: hypothetical protein JWL77_5265 [Chthonomonadaceae bacterium]|nr:hypothetical protein [Chthonomonadaceae bacterium]
MANPSEGPTPAEETILEAAKHARKMHTLLRGGAWVIMAIGVATVASIICYPKGFAHSPLFPWFLGATLCTLPLLFYYVYIEQSAGASFGKLADLLMPGQNDVRQSVSTSMIGPLLDVMMPGAIHGGFLLALATLLGDLLKSVRPDEGVVLTESQRNLLHELVTPKLLRADWLKTSYGPWIEKDVRSVLRAPAVRGLGVLGNDASIPILERFARKTGDADLRALALQSVEQIRERLQVPSVTPQAEEQTKQAPNAVQGRTESR